MTNSQGAATDLRKRSLRAAIGAAVLALAASSAAGSPARACDEFWIISTRHIQEVSCQSLPSQVRVYRRACNCWQPDTLDHFLAESSAAAITLFYIHGNRCTWDDAVEGGYRAHRRLRQGSGPGLPLRFVIWSWPSDAIPGIINDVRLKAERTDLEGLYLGTVLSRMPPEALVSILGYSYGTRIASGALHLLGGGRLEGRTLPREALVPRIPLRVGLVAPAFQNTWLLPGAFHELALTQVERLLVIYNSRDPVLRRYRIVAPASYAQALGFTGLVGLERLGPLAARVQQWDVAREVGRTHDEARYLATSPFAPMREYLMWRTQ